MKKRIVIALLSGSVVAAMTSDAHYAATVAALVVLVICGTGEGD